jgi:SAM-dependent methyltransferase
MTSPPDQFARIAAYFDDLVAKYGRNHRACDYGSPQSQRTRFDVLSTICPLDNKSVLDVGCGFADLATYLHERYRGVSYRGIDVSPEMIRMAHALHPNVAVKSANILTTDVGNYDVVIANGIFYLLGPDAWSVMQKLIARMFEIATEAVAFSSLSSLASNQVPGEFHADPSKVLAYCQTLTPRVALRHDYYDHDFMVFMYKSQARSN